MRDHHLSPAGTRLLETLITDAGRHTEVAEGLDDMREDARDPRIHDDVYPKAKHGVQSVVPGPSLTIKVWAMQKQIRQLDALAGEIRAAGGIWVTRSAMITAFIEAALRSEPLLDVLTSQSRSIRKPSLILRTPPHPSAAGRTPHAAGKTPRSDGEVPSAEAEQPF